MIRLASSTDLPVLEQVYDVARAYARKWKSRSVV